MASRPCRNTLAWALAPMLRNEGNSSVTATQTTWPRKCDLFGVRVSATSYDEVVELIAQAARRNESAAITAFAVHGLVTAADDPAYRDQVNTFDIVSPDGQPVRWALNRFYDTQL